MKWIIIVLLLGVFAAGAALLYYTMGSVDPVDEPALIEEKESARAPTRDTDVEPVKTENVRVVDVPIADTTVSEKVVLNKYEDPNYDFSITYPSGYEYTVNPSSVVFSSKERSMIFQAEVIYTLSNGGIFSNAEAVKEDYINQLEEFKPAVEGIESDTDNMFVVEYMIPGRAVDVNHFLIRETDDYFYVLQFMVPKSEFKTENVLIDEIISDFEVY